MACLCVLTCISRIRHRRHGAAKADDLDKVLLIHLRFDDPVAGCAFNLLSISRINTHVGITAVPVPTLTGTVCIAQDVPRQRKAKVRADIHSPWIPVRFRSPLIGMDKLVQDPEVLQAVEHEPGAVRPPSCRERLESLIVRVIICY